MTHFPTAVAVALAALFCSSCQTHQSASQPSHPGDMARVALPEVTWAFNYHSFGAYCYNTIGCKVLYSNVYEVRDGEDEVAPPRNVPGIQKYWASQHGGIRNFPRPALVTWRSLDGTAHEVEVDIGAIFKEQRVIHDVPTEKLSALAARGGGRPGIMLVVDDRTISVYMRTLVSLREPEMLRDHYRHVRDEPVLAYRRTY